MSAPQMSPHLLKGGFVVLDPASGQVVRILPFQYNPEQLVHAIAPGGETFTLVAEYDATDELEAGRATASEHGIAPQLAALRAAAAERPPAILAFVWGASRIVPVDLLSLTVSETMFDSSLNPLTATVAIELQVVTATAGTDIRARLATAYADKQKELASLVPAGTLAALGVTGLITGELAR